MANPMERNQEQTLTAAVAPPLPAYDAADLASRDPEALIDLLIQDEDRAPRALIDACAARGEAMVERLAQLVAPDRRWSEPGTDGEWWLRLHAVMILGLIESERAGRLLVSFMRRLERANDADIQGWLVGYWPILFRNKPDAVSASLRKLAQARSVSWNMRVQAAGSVFAMARRNGADALDAALDWASGMACDQTEDRDLRVALADALLDFPRERYRQLLRDLAGQHAGGVVLFSRRDVAEAYAAGKDSPEWQEHNDPWEFYEPSAIAERQEHWARGEHDADGYELREPVMPFVREAPKVGRNDPCPCGSGKKYKKCCMDKSERL
jgi:hypothetical protein